MKLPGGIFNSARPRIKVSSLRLMTKPARESPQSIRVCFEGRGGMTLVSLGLTLMPQTNGGEEWPSAWWTPKD